MSQWELSSKNHFNSCVGGIHFDVRSKECCFAVFGVVGVTAEGQKKVDGNRKWIPGEYRITTASVNTGGKV